ncbi:MAG: hypothetical protein K8R85_07430 [Bacteroidetes bacterium]|nr:hypothetical protein [Bacteroidota bacterium]
MKVSNLLIRKIAVVVFTTLVVGSIDKVFGQTDTLWQATDSNTIATNKYVKINNNLDVHGKLTVDSMRVRGALHIGDSSLTLIDDVTDIGTGVKSDHIRSTQGRIAFFGDNGVGGFNNNINLGIGVHNPTGKVDIKYNGTGNLKIGDGNRAITGGNSAGNLNIESTNILALNQYSNGNISDGKWC